MALASATTIPESTPLAFAKVLAEVINILPCEGELNTKGIFLR
jgi:hypothetical protein